MSYRICTSCGASDGQGCYRSCPTMLQSRVVELEAALQWIDRQRYTDRSTITPDNAFERAVSLNDQLVMIMDKARAALAPSQEPVCDTHHPPQASEMMEPHIDVAEYDKTRWD